MSNHEKKKEKKSSGKDNQKKNPQRTYLHSLYQLEKE
jgi:hypothetical protein